MTFAETIYHENGPVGDQPRPIQNIFEQSFTQGGALRFSHAVEPMRSPGIRATFDDEGASVGGVAVMMRLPMSSAGR